MFCFTHNGQNSNFLKELSSAGAGCHVWAKWMDAVTAEGKQIQNNRTSFALEALDLGFSWRTQSLSRKYCKGHTENTSGICCLQVVPNFLAKKRTERKNKKGPR